MNSEDATNNEMYYYPDEATSDLSLGENSNNDLSFGNIVSSESSSYFDVSENVSIVDVPEFNMNLFNSLNLLNKGCDIPLSFDWMSNDTPIELFPINELPVSTVVNEDPINTTKTSIPVALVASNEDLVESSMDNQKYPLDNGFPIQDQADASDSSSENSTDSLSDNILITGVYYPEKKKSKRRRSKRVWTTQENMKLLAICNELQVTKNHRCWKLVEKKMGDSRTAKQCREHYANLISKNKKSTWSEEEDAILLRFLNSEISEEELTRKLKRSAKQISERKAILERNTRNWEKEEDELILRLSYEKKSVRTITKELRNHGFNRINQQVKDRMNYLKENVHP